MMTVAETVPREHVRHAKYERLIARAKEVPAAATIVVHPCDATSLRGAAEAAEAGLIAPTFVGPAAKVARVAREFAIDVERFPVVDVPHSDAAAERAVELVHEAKGELLMKGSLHTDEMMRAVTSAAKGLRTARRISHVFVMDVPTYPDVLFVTDAANMLAKNLTFLAQADAAGIVLGARVPIILTSRADSLRTRMASCAVAVLYADARRRMAARKAT
jgi:phosphate acetyltransferase